MDYVALRWETCLISAGKSMRSSSSDPFLWGIFDIALWAHVTSGNSHCFSDPSDSPFGTALTAGECLPLGLCKGTVKKSRQGLWPISQNLYVLIIENLVKIPLTVIMILMIQSGYNFAHAMAAELSWHVQNCGLMGSLFFK